ncbi:MAG TPA: Gfo/Idh/MocA family oxidoreductase [Chthoniobacterales bacterium]
MGLAVAGAGALGRRWVEVLGGLAEVEVKAVVDPLVGGPQAPAWLEDHPAVEKFSSLDLLPSGHVEAVLVTASSPAHYKAVKKGLERGLHVLVEKPFATSLEDARTLVGLAQQRGRTLMVSQNYRFFSGVKAVRELVRTGELGAVCAVIGQFWCNWPGKPYQHAMIHPMALEMAIHHFDLVRAIFDAEADTGHVIEWNPPGSPYRFGGGALEALFSMGSPAGPFPFIYSGSLVSKAPQTPWGGHWRFEFARATLFAEKVEGQYLLFRKKEGGVEATAPFGDDSMAFDQSFRHFFQAVRQGTEPWCSGRDNLGSLEMALAFNRLPGSPNQAPDLPPS